MKAEELIENNALQNIKVESEQKVVFEEIAITAVNMARKEEKERAYNALEFVLDEWINSNDVELFLREFKAKMK